MKFQLLSTVLTTLLTLTSAIPHPNPNPVPVPETTSSLAATTEQEPRSPIELEGQEIDTRNPWSPPGGGFSGNDNCGSSPFE